MIRPVLPRGWLILPVAAVFLVFSACSNRENKDEPAGEAETMLTRLPDAGFGLRLPEGMEAVNPEQFKTMQDESAGYEPILPFTDFPCYGFVNAASGAVLIVSKLNFAGSETDRDDPVGVMDEYRRNLESYYGVDSIAADKVVMDDCTLLVMNFQYLPSGETSFLVKVLYYKYPQEYALLDLYLDSTKTGPEDAQKFNDMFNSIQSITVSKEGL
jgi:hypothetical protein